MNKGMIGLIVFITLVVLMFIFIKVTTEEEDDPASEKTSYVSIPESNSSNNDSTKNEDRSEISAETVAEHNSKSDCWTIINGQIYDITSYIPHHPGGDEILLACGIDGSSLFNSRTTQEGVEIGSGTPHNPSSENLLQVYLIGTLQ